MLLGGGSRPLDGVSQWCLERRLWLCQSMMVPGGGLQSFLLLVCHHPFWYTRTRSGGSDCGSILCAASQFEAAAPISELCPTTAQASLVLAASRTRICWSRGIASRRIRGSSWGR
eukprot:2762164-Rhodomonas_salina.1